jgi:hypothetical protein
MEIDQQNQQRVRRKTESKVLIQQIFAQEALAQT